MRKKTKRKGQTVRKLRKMESPTSENVDISFILQQKLITP